jgi:transposase InsO family protein
MDEIIKKYYENYLYPSLDDMYKYMKEDKISVTRAQIKTYLDKLEENQITKETKNKKETYGHITASHENQEWQMDIFILQKYVKFNKGYRDILCCIDVFSRKVYCVAMKNKGIDDVTDALTTIFKTDIPQKITSDSDSSFLGRKLQTLLKKHQVIHQTVAIGDHHSLGIVDRFARVIKSKFVKIILKNNGIWYTYLDRVIDQYNDKPHSSIGDISPNDVNKDDNYALIVHINHLKSLKNDNVTDLIVGDKVRILETTIFTKGTEPQYSKTIYIVKSVNGKRITLNNDQIKKRNMLLKIPNDTKPSDNNKTLIKLINQDNKNERQYIREHTKIENIVREPRIRKKVTKLDL